MRLILYTTLNCPERPAEVCLEYLDSVGLACPRNPTEQEVAQEYERVWLQLRGRTIEELAGLAPMTDPACRGALEVITAIVPPSWFTEENLRNLLVARMVNLSLEYGNSEASCYAYALLARTLGSHFGDYETGYRFGSLSLELVELCPRLRHSMLGLHYGHPLLVELGVGLADEFGGGVELRTERCACDLVELRLHRV